MAKKKVTQLHQAPDSGWRRQPPPPVGPALGAAQVNIMQFCQAFNAATQDKQGRHHPRRDHGLRGPHLRLRLQDPRPPLSSSRRSSASRGRLRRSPARQGRPALPGAAHQDRRDQDAGPQRQRHRGRQEDRRRHRSLHGRHHRLSRAQSLKRRGSFPDTRVGGPRSPMTTGGRTCLSTERTTRPPRPRSRSTKLYSPKEAMELA